MAGSVSFPLTVEVAFGSGPMDTTGLTWTDISAYVRKSGTVSLSRGYDQEADQPLAGRASFSVNNDDGRFTPGKSSGPYGLVRNKLPVRVKRGSTVLWTGVIEKLAMSYDNGMRPIVNVTCVDRWARLEARKFLAERLVPAITATGATHLWPMTDISGSTRLVDTIGGYDLTPEDPTKTSYASASNPQTGNGANVVSSTSSVGTVGAVIASGATAWTISAWLYPGSAVKLFEIKQTLIPENFLSLTLAADRTYSYESDAGALYENYFSSPATTTTAWHHLTMTGSYSGGTTTVKYYLDAALISTKTLAATFTRDLTRIEVLGTGIAYFATWNQVLSASTIATLTAVAIPGSIAGDTPAVRAGRIKAATGDWTLTTQGTFSATMSSPAWSDKSVATTLNECAQAERGAIFIDTAGWPVLQSRTYRTGSAVAATIPAKVLAADAQWELDDQQLCNVVQVDRMAAETTATTISRRNESSIASYDEAAQSLQLWLYTDEEAAQRANAEVNLNATPAARSRTFAVNVATCQTAISEATLLAVDVGSRIKLSGLPSTAPAATTSGFFVESIEDNITHTQWIRTFTVSTALDFWTLEDVVYGVIDSTFVLAY